MQIERFKATLWNIPDKTITSPWRRAFDRSSIRKVTECSFKTCKSCFFYVFRDKVKNGSRRQKCVSICILVSCEAQGPHTNPHMISHFMKCVSLRGSVCVKCVKNRSLCLWNTNTHSHFFFSLQMRRTFMRKIKHLSEETEGCVERDRGDDAPGEEEAGD
ncbi:hypothetical protein NL108_013445 [Boleophthalmus pectinirostris]|nr:hypothetical protein NL108_013445 [Boleophthalmus pectinirostris]